MIAPDTLIIVAGIGLFLWCVVFAPWAALAWFAASVALVLLFASPQSADFDEEAH